MVPVSVRQNMRPAMTGGGFLGRHRLRGACDEEKRNEQFGFHDCSPEFLK